MGSKQGRYREIVVIVLCFLLSASASCAGDKSSQAQSEKKEPVREEAALVNGTAITREELEQELERVRQQFTRRGMPVDEQRLAQLRKSVLENLINTELLYQESQKQGVSVEEGAVEEQVQMIKKQSQSEENFKKEMQRLKYSEESLKTQLRRGLAIQKLLKQEIGDRLSVSEQETEQYYKNNPAEFKQPEQVRASHILIKVAPDADKQEKDKARRQIEQLRARLKKGEDFAALAKEFSQGPSAAKGGDLGYFSRGQMVKPFEDAAFALEPNQVSEVVETRFGYHLIKLSDKKAAATIPYDLIKGGLARNLKQKKVRAEIKKYIQTLKEKGKVQNFLGKQL